MRPQRPAPTSSLFSAVLGLGLLAGLAPSALAQDSFKIEPTKEAPPAALAAPIRESLKPEGFKIVDGGGKVYAEFWLRKATPASEKPAGPKGPVQFPFLADGELLGALRFPGEGRDNRDQSIAKGIYTLRYGLQPVNGDHLGVSPFRDYVLMLPAAKDTAVAGVPRKALEEKSSESAGTSHPAVMLLSAPAPSAAVPSVTRDEEKNTWSAVVPLSVQVKGESGTTAVNVQVLFLGVLGA
ncbi:MAG: hypothetical protein U0835_13735 [Isosphaeraceae bacterium]